MYFMIQPDGGREEFNKFLAILGPHRFFALLAGRSELVNNTVWRVPESSPNKVWKWIKPENLYDSVAAYQRIGWTTWVSLNDMEQGHMWINSVRRVSVIWFDVDAPRGDKIRPADEEEKIIAKIEAERLKKYLEKKYGAVCFLACSGNGWHLYCPIASIALPTARDSWWFNARLKEWMKKVREESGVEFDHTYNINRLVQPIGFPNRKIPHHLLPTYWYDRFNKEDVKVVRSKNAALAKNILAMKIDESSSTEQPETKQVRNHPTLKELLRRDVWFRNMYEGYWTKYGYISRSEAEQALVRELVHWGFSDAEIDAVMRRCGIGKWRQTGESYHKNTIQKAREWEARKMRR